MPFYPVKGIEEKLRNIENRVRIMCSIYPIVLLDEYKKMILLLYIAEYITIKNRDDSMIRDDNYIIDHKHIARKYNLNMHKAVNAVLMARDWMCHEPDSKRQIRSWRNVWDNKLVEQLLKYEGFLD